MWHGRYTGAMARTITQRQLRNDSGAIMRQLQDGETFVVTRNGVPVGELVPLRRERLVPAETVTALFAGAAPLDAARFRADLDAGVDPSGEPRG